MAETWCRGDRLVSAASFGLHECIHGEDLEGLCNGCSDGMYPERVVAAMAPALPAAPAPEAQGEPLRCANCGCAVDRSAPRRFYVRRRSVLLGGECIDQHDKEGCPFEVAETYRPCPHPTATPAPAGREEGAWAKCDGAETLRALHEAFALSDATPPRSELAEALRALRHEAEWMWRQSAPVRNSGKVRPHPESTVGRAFALADAALATPQSTCPGAGNGEAVVTHPSDNQPIGYTIRRPDGTAMGLYTRKEEAAGAAFRLGAGYSAIAVHAGAGGGA